jgi:hypothetical protein
VRFRHTRGSASSVSVCSRSLKANNSGEVCDQVFLLISTLSSHAPSRIGSRESLKNQGLALDVACSTSSNMRHIPAPTSRLVYPTSSSSFRRRLSCASSRRVEIAGPLLVNPAMLSPCPCATASNIGRILYFVDMLLGPVTTNARRIVLFLRCSLVGIRRPINLLERPCSRQGRAWDLMNRCKHPCSISILLCLPRSHVTSTCAVSANQTRLQLEKIGIAPPLPPLRCSINTCPAS